MKANQFRRDRSFAPAQPRRDVTEQEKESPHKIRAASHLKGRSYHLPKRMAPQVIILTTEFEIGAQCRRTRGAHRTMMMGHSLSERSGFPAFHPRRGNGQPVDTTSSNRDIASDLLKAFTPKDMAGAGDMVGAVEAETVGWAVLGERGSDQAEFG